MVFLCSLGLFFFSQVQKAHCFDLFGSVKFLPNFLCGQHRKKLVDVSAT